MPSLSEGLGTYVTIINNAPMQVKLREYPSFFSVPLYLLTSGAIYIFIKNYIGIALNTEYYVFFVSLAAGALTVLFCRYLSEFKETERATIVDFKEDAFSGIREAMKGDWNIHHDRFSEKVGFNDFSLRISVSVIQENKKLSFHINKQNTLEIHDKIENVSLVVKEDKNSVRLNFFIDRSLAIKDASIRSDFKYFYDLTWEKTIPETKKWIGTWYALGDLGSQFRAAGPCEFYPINDKLPSIVTN
jgi:hypothetical protein